MAKKHTEEFRQEAVRIALTSGLPRRQVAENLSVGFQTLAKWMQRSRSTDDLPVTADIDLAKKVERLRKEKTIAKKKFMSARALKDFNDWLNNTSLLKATE